MVKRLRHRPFTAVTRVRISLGSFYYITIYADMAQLAEQLICNQQVIGSSPIIGFCTISYCIYGQIPEWPKGTDCKSAANCFGGSNPPLPYLPCSLQGVLLPKEGYLILRGASRLDAFSVYPFQTWLLCHAVGRQQIHQWSVHPGPLVLRTAPLKYPPPAPDRDRTVSRRSEPSSRTALMGEQPNPWDLLQPQDAMSRHRGAKPLRRCELLGVISLLSPG